MGFGASGRKHVQNPAADGVFPDHLDRLAPLVADALQVRDHFLERQLVAHPQLERELPVIISGLDPHQGRSHRHDGDGHPLGGQPPQSRGALLADVGVRRKVLKRQNIQSGQELRAVAVVRREQREESMDGFREGLSLLVAIYYNYQRMARGLPQEHRIEGLGGGGETRERGLAARGQAAQSILEAGMLRQVQKQIANGRMNQGRLRILSTILVVEYPGSRATVSTLPPAASTSSRPATKCDQSAPLTSTSGRTQRNQLARRVLVEQRDRIDGFQRQGQFRAFPFRDQRPGRPLGAPRTGIGVQCENENVAERAGLLQEPDVARDAAGHSSRW